VRVEKGNKFRNVGLRGPSGSKRVVTQKRKESMNFWSVTSSNVMRHPEPSKKSEMADGLTEKKRVFVRLAGRPGGKTGPGTALCTPSESFPDEKERVRTSPRERDKGDAYLS